MYDYLQYVLYKSMKFVAPKDGYILCPKHVGAVNNKYCATNWK